MSHSLLSQWDWQLNEPVGRNQPWSVGRISWLCQQSRSFLSLPETVGAQACRPCPGSHLQSSCWGCVAASPSGSAAGQRLDEPRQTEESEKERQRQRGEMETRRWKVLHFTHLLLASAHISCRRRISSRLSGWSWRSRQTCAPSSLPAETAVKTNRDSAQHSKGQTHMSQKPLVRVRTKVLLQSNVSDTRTSSSVTSNGLILKSVLSSLVSAELQSNNVQSGACEIWRLTLWPRQTMGGRLLSTSSNIQSLFLRSVKN